MWHASSYLFSAYMQPPTDVVFVGYTLGRFAGGNSALAVKGGFPTHTCIAHCIPGHYFQCSKPQEAEPWELTGRIQRTPLVGSRRHAAAGTISDHLTPKLSFNKHTLCVHARIELLLLMVSCFSTN